MTTTPNHTLGAPALAEVVDILRTHTLQWHGSNNAARCTGCPEIVTSQPGERITDMQHRHQASQVIEHFGAQN